MNLRSARSLALTAPLSLVIFSGCDLLDAATATTVVGALVVATPAVSVPGRLEISDEVVATVWVGERLSPESTAAPDPIGDANVGIVFDGTTVPVPVENAAAGVYAQTSVAAPTLTYVGGTSYTIEAVIDGARFGGSVTAPPALSAAALTLDPSPTMVVPDLPEVGEHPRDTALTLSWPAQFGEYTYVTVFRADPNDPTNPQQVFDNRPTTTSEILQFIVGGSPTTQTIPADVFGQDGLYAVILVAMDGSSMLLPDTFLGSPILVGSGAVVLLGVGQI